MNLKIQQKRNNPGKLAKRFFANPYQIINVILIGFILLIFVYSAVFSPEKNNYPVHSADRFFMGGYSLSTGLSRGFSSIIRFRFNEALNYNPFSIRIFIFFVIQLCLRIFFLWFSRKPLYGELRYTVIPDIAISVVLFLVFFEPFWREILAEIL